MCFLGVALPPQRTYYLSYYYLEYKQDLLTNLPGFLFFEKQ